MKFPGRKIIVCVLVIVSLALILTGFLRTKDNDQHENENIVDSVYSAKNEISLWLVHEGRKNLRAGRESNAKDYAITASFFENNDEVKTLVADCDEKGKALRDFMTVEMKEAISAGDVVREMRALNFVKHIDRVGPR